MKISINGKATEHQSGASLLDILTAVGAKEPFAVALNGRFVPRSQCSATRLNEGDSIEILSPIQGG